MKLGIILNTNAPETAWNALRLGNKAIETGSQVSLFLMGEGVEVESIKDKLFDVPSELRGFIAKGGRLAACGTCIKARQMVAGVCPISTMGELVSIIEESDKVVTFG